MNKYCFRFFCIAMMISLLVPMAVLALGLDECIELALQNNPDLQKQQMNEELAQSDLTGEKSRRFGSLDAVASYTHYNLPRTLVPMTPATISAGSLLVATTEDLFVSGVMYEVPLFTGFARTRSVEIAALQKEISASVLRLSREQLIYNVRTLYTNILSFGAQVEAQEVYIDALQRLFDDIILGLELGKKARIDQLKAAADLENAKAGKVQIEANRHIVTATLAGLLAVDVETVSDLEDIDDIDVVAKTESASAVPLDDLERYRQAKLAIEKSDKLIEKNNAGLYPQISFNAFYGQNYGPNDDSNALSGDWENKEVWQAGINARWNIFDFGSRRAELQKARIARKQSMHDKEKIELELKTAFIEAQTKIETAVADYKSAKTELAMNRESEIIEQTRFDMGAGDINDLLQAKARSRMAHSRFINAGYTYRNAQYYLEYLLEDGEKK